MPEDRGSSAGYHIGSVGPGAQVAQGTNITQTMQQAGVAIDDLQAPFEDVFKAIEADDQLDDDDKQIAAEATREVLEATSRASEDPPALRRALGKAKKLLGSSWATLVKAMESDAVQKTIGTIAEASLQASIKAVLT